MTVETASLESKPSPSKTPLLPLPALIPSVCSPPPVNTIALTLPTSISYIILTPAQLSATNTTVTVKMPMEHLTDVSDKEINYVSEPQPIT
jgi:hypothetical protein